MFPEEQSPNLLREEGKKQLHGEVDTRLNLWEINL